MACVALWWRRRWPLGVGLAVVAIGKSSRPRPGWPSRCPHTVAAYRRWQLALLVAAAQVALLPLGAHPAPGPFAGGVLPDRHVRPGGGHRLGHVPPHRLQAQRERARRVEAEEQFAHRAGPLRRAHRTRVRCTTCSRTGSRCSACTRGVLEFRPDAPRRGRARRCRIRASAHQALEDLRAVIGVLRDGPTARTGGPPQPTLAALPGA